MVTIGVNGSTTFAYIDTGKEGEWEAQAELEGIDE